MEAQAASGDGMTKHFLHSFVVKFTTPRRIEDNLGELVSYDKDNPDRHNRLVHVVVPETGYKDGATLALAWVKANYEIAAYKDVSVARQGDPIEIDAVIRIA